MIKVFDNPVITMVLGVGIFVTGFIELLEQFSETFEHWIGAHHGVLIFGMVAMLRGTIDILEGMEIVELDAKILEDKKAEALRHASVDAPAAPGGLL